MDLRRVTALICGGRTTQTITICQVEHSGVVDTRSETQYTVASKLHGGFGSCTGLAKRPSDRAEGRFQQL